MENEVLFNDAAKQQLKKGIDTVCNAVKVTLGPQGRNVIINKGMDYPHITKDGVTVAKEIFLNNPYEMMGANLIKSIASKTCDDAGDGCQPLYSKIYTPNGYIKMGDVKIGDEICGTNNTIQKVIGVFPQGERKIYKMKFDHQRETKCCGYHIWSVINEKGEYENLKTSELIENFDKHKYYIPKTSIEFNTRKLPIDPYLLGLLIGDGCLRKNGSIELSIGYKKEYIIDEIIVPEGIEFNVKDYKDKNYLRIKFKGIDIYGKTMKDYLNDLGLLDCKSGTKFIPELYLYSDYNQRSSLLSGILNTDGYINRHGLFEISTISNKLNDDIINLSRSLGKSVNTRVKIRKPGGSYSMTSINAINELKGNKYGIQLMEIEDTGEYEVVQCIKVSNPDELYITDDYIVTHNTSNSTVLSQHIINNGYKIIKTHPDSNPIEIKRGIEKASDIVVDFVKKSSVKINGNFESIRQVATISANNDEEIGKLIAEAIYHVGEYGAVTIEKSHNAETTLSSTSGFRISQRGYLSPYFITNESKGECVLEDVYIFITDKKLDKTSDVLPLLNIVSGQNKSLLIIAEDVTGDALSTLVLNKIQAGIKICAIKGPEFGQNRKDSLIDLAVLVDAKVDSIMQDGTFGYATKVIVKKENTIIIGANGSKENVDKRTNELLDLKSNLKEDFEIKLINERLSRFSNGVSVLNIGAKTEIELVEKMDRIDDALNATKAAIEEGVVPGGGIMFLKAKDQLLKNKYKFSKEELYGFDVLFDSLSAPINQILLNAGVDPEEIIDEILEKKKLFYGYNAKTYKYGDLFKQGVIDPAKVLRVALQNAVSVSVLFLTTECAIISNA